MYHVSCDGHPLLDWRDDDLILVNPKVKLAVNTVGEASFTLYKNHPHYDKLKRAKSIFEISDEVGVIFRGRMTGDTIDFDNGKAVDLEGAMAYFNDSIVRPFTYPDDFLTNAGYIAASKGGNVIQFFLKWLIDNHNNQVQEFQRFKLGKVTVTDPNNYLHRYSTEHANTWEILKSRLFDSGLGGYLCIRYEADGNYIDYLSEFELTNMQEIVFGENLMDLKNETDGTATFSAIIPLGTDSERTVSAGTVEGEFVDFELTKTVKGKLDISGLPNGNVTDDIVKDGDTLYSISAVEQCGWIYAPTEETTWDDVEKAETLLTKGIEWLKANGMMSANTIEVTAVDLHFSDAEISSFRIYRNINVRSEPHGVVNTYPLSSLDIDLLNPQNTKITVGETRLTLIDKQNSTSTSTADKIGNLTNQENLIGIVDVKTLYYLSKSDEELTGGTWVKEEPSRTEGTFIWTKNVILYTDKSTYESPPTCSTGSKGDPGIGVDVIETEFYLSTSSTTQSGGKWVTTMPQWSEGKYLWTRSVVHYSDGSTSYTSPECDSSWEAVNNLDNKLDQEEVFNRLTNSGALQGLYMENGKLYINASYIKTGEFLADLIKTGAIKSRSDSGSNFTLDLDNGSISIVSAESGADVLGEMHINNNTLYVEAEKNDGNKENRVNLSGDANQTELYLRRENAHASIQVREDFAEFSLSLPLEGLGFNVQAVPDGVYMSGVNAIDGITEVNYDTSAVNKGYVDKNFLKRRRLLTSADDCDNLTDDGVYWYSTSSVPKNAPFENAAVILVFGNDSTTTQKIQFGFRYGMAGHGKFRPLYNTWQPWAEFAGYIEDTTYPGCYYRYTNGVQEWVNPPMVTGVEYRTTERHNGKPVYCKTLETGALTQGTITVTHGLSITDTEFVRADAYIIRPDGRYYPLPMISSSGNISATYRVTINQLDIYAFSDLSAYTGRVTLYYCKN